MRVVHQVTIIGSLTDRSRYASPVLVPHVDRIGHAMCLGIAAKGELGTSPELQVSKAPRSWPRRSWANSGLLSLDHYKNACANLHPFGAT